MRTLLASIIATVGLSVGCRTAAPDSQPLVLTLPGAETFTLESPSLAELRRVCVYLPPGYDQGDARYPVLYLPDGGAQEDFPHVVEAVHFGVSWGLLRPMLVVGIENTERRRDLTGPTQVESDREVAPRVGGSAAFRDFLRDELMPEIARRYRTSQERAIMGESVAGLFVVETFFLEPGLFDTWIAFSPSLWWNDHELVRRAGERLEADPARRARLYLTSADEQDIAPHAAALALALGEHAPEGLEWSYLPRPDEFHDTIYRASAPRALRVLFPAPAAD